MKEHRVFDENGKDAIVYEPFYDARHRVWLGEPPPRDSPDNPPCPTCEGGEEELELLVGEHRSLIHMYPHLDSSNLFHYTVYQCRICGERFRV